MHSCEIDEEEEGSDYRAAVLIQTNMEDHTYNLPSEERETLSKKRKRDKAKRNRDRLRQKNRVNIGAAFPRWKSLKDKFADRHRSFLFFAWQVRLSVELYSYMEPNLFVYFREKSE